MPHGTMVAGMLGAIKGNGRGIIGADPEVKIMSLKTDFTTAQLVRAVEFAKANGAQIINASWGATLGTCSSYWDKALYEAIGGYPGLFVAAAGNNARMHDGSDFLFFPADYSHNTSCWSGLSNVISVAATDSRDELAGFSDYGENFVDVGAPGENIATTYATFGYPVSDEDGSDDLYATASGTSFAAPHVAGVAALALGKDGNLSAQEVKNILMQSGDITASLTGKTVSGKRINALGSLSRSSGGESNQNETKALGDLKILGESPETSYVRLAQIRVENPESAQYFRLSKNKKKMKKMKWRPMPGDIAVRLAKTKKKQRFYIQFRDEEGNQSPVYGKTFLFRKS